MESQAQEIEVGYKKCSKCGLVKSLENFHKNSYSKNGLRSSCKTCLAQYRQRPECKIAEAKRRNTQKPIPIERCMFYGARLRAKARVLEFDLTLEDIVVPEVCPILGISLFREKVRGREKTSNSPSLDRKDPTKGYIKDNVWVISWRANRIKSNATLDELKLLVKNLALHGIK